MVMVLLDHVADTPAGKLLAPGTPSFTIPVAKVVVWVIFVSGVLIHNVGVEEATPAVFVTILNEARALVHGELVEGCAPPTANVHSLTAFCTLGWRDFHNIYSKHNKDSVLV